MTAGKRRVLVVDDEPHVRRIAEVSLRGLGGWDVVACASGREAVALASRETFDAILLDVMMPEMDGPATLALLRGDAALASIPVVFLTATSDAAARDRYLDLGARGVLEKPFDPMKLSERISRALGWTT